jgi:hypothetical protein
MNDSTAQAGNVEIRDSRFRMVVGDSVTIERIATGFLFTEGPLWHPVEKYLLFSDMPGDHLRRWTVEGVTTFRKPCAQSNGLAWDRQGRLIACEHATSQVTRTEGDGSSTVIARHHDGKELNSPNDVVVKSDGGIYFTDPTYGRNEYFGNPRPLPRDFRGVYRAEPEGERVTLLADDFAPAEWIVLCARRAAAVRQRHRAPTHPRVRRPRGRRAREQPGVRADHGGGRRRARRHENRQCRQHLLLRPRRRSRV